MLLYNTPLNVGNMQPHIRTLHAVRRNKCNRTYMVCSTAQLTTSNIELASGVRHLERNSSRILA